MKKTASYDFYLVLATTAVLFVISLICIYGMFYFKLAQIQQMAPAIKLAYMQRMNTIVSPFLVALILLLGICVPKRLLPTRWLNGVAVLLIALVTVVSLFHTVKTGLLVMLVAALCLQVVVLCLAIAGSDRLSFEKKGYWVRVGSSLIHLGLILFILDLFLFQQQGLHLLLFWVTTIATVFGMLFSFYAATVAAFLKVEPEAEPPSVDK